MQVNSTSFTRSQARKTLGDVVYIEKAEFPSGMLPTRKDIIQNMLYLLRPNRAGQAQRSRDSRGQLLAELVQEHWLFCNLYTIHTRHIKKHILKLYGDFMTLSQTRKQRQNDNFFKRVEAFNAHAQELFDVFCQDAVIRKKLEQKHGVEMSDMEWDFLKDQRIQRKMYCEDFVDRKWMKSMERRQRDIQAIEKMREDAEKEKELSKPVALKSSEQSQSDSEVDERSMDTEEGEPFSSESCDEDTSAAATSQPKKRRLTSTSILTQPSDDLPPK